MTPPRRGGRRMHAGGFTLLSVLVAMVITGLGVLGIVRAALVATNAATQNEFVSTLATLSNGFWGVVQSNPAMVTSSSFSGTFAAGSTGNAPAPLQAWLTQATSNLPGGQVTIATGPDAASGNPCTATTGCTVVLTMSWTQTRSPIAAQVTRSQVFYYQFGL